jgi:hypothetical protein
MLNGLTRQIRTLVGLLSPVLCDHLELGAGPEYSWPTTVGVGRCGAW